MAARHSKQPSLSSVPGRFSGRHFADEAVRLMFDDGDGADLNVSIETTQGATKAEIINAGHILCNSSNADICKFCDCIMLHLCKEFECLPKKSLQRSI